MVIRMYHSESFLHNESVHNFTVFQGKNFKMPACSSYYSGSVIMHSLSLQLLMLWAIGIVTYQSILFSYCSGLMYWKFGP